MALNLFYFIVSFLGDSLAFIFYQKYLEGHKRDVSLLILALISAFFVWFFIFKLQDRGQILRVFIPLWSSGTAVFGYFFAGIMGKTPLKDLFNPYAVICVVAIALGIYFLQKQTPI